MEGSQDRSRSPTDSTLVHPPSSPDSLLRYQPMTKVPKLSQTCSPGPKPYRQTQEDPDDDHRGGRDYCSSPLQLSSSSSPSLPFTAAVPASTDASRYTFHACAAMFVSRHLSGQTISEIEVFSVRTARGCHVDGPSGKLIAFPDTGSEVNLVSEDSVPNHASASVRSPRINITGIGYAGRPLCSNRKMKLRLHLRSGTPAVAVWCYIISGAAIPTGVDILLGKPFLRHLAIKPDPANQRLEIGGDHNMIINTMPVSKQVSIFGSAPLRFLEICGGASFSFHTLTNLGYDFVLYHSIEIDPMARGVAKAHSDNQVQHPHPHDLLLCSDLLTTTYTDVLVTNECGPWSRASGPGPLEVSMIPELNYSLNPVPLYKINYLAIHS